MGRIYDNFSEVKCRILCSRVSGLVRLLFYLFSIVTDPSMVLLGLYLRKPICRAVNSPRFFRRFPENYHYFLILMNKFENLPEYIVCNSQYFADCCSKSLWLQDANVGSSAFCETYFGEILKCKKVSEMETHYCVRKTNYDL